MIVPSNCRGEILNQGARPVPRTCAVCGLGPCHYIQHSPPKPLDRAIVQRTELILHETDALEAMLTRALPPVPGQTGTLVVSKSRERAEAVWRFALDAIPHEKAIEARRKLTWPGSQSATFGCADDRDMQGRIGVHRYAGFWCEVLCIDRMQDFTEFDLCYLISTTQRSAARYRPRLLATR